MSKRTNRQDDRRKFRRIFKQTDWPRIGHGKSMRAHYGSGLTQKDVRSDRRRTQQEED